MATIFEPAAFAELTRRIGTVERDAPRQWGRMSVEGMVCHLNDAFLMVLGERPSEKKPSWVERTALRFLALHTPMPWPKGAQTPAEVDQEKGGSQPGEFDQDKLNLQSTLERFANEAQARSMFHPIFGQLSTPELGRWAYRHVDHHLRQFDA